MNANIQHMRKQVGSKIIDHVERWGIQSPTAQWE